MTSSSQAGSRNCANHTALQENGWEKKTNATCGQKCLEQYRKSDHATWWGKMFADSLVGTGDWYSMRCRLTWKLKVTSSSRLYFQLAPSTLPTEEKGFGLWPTPTSVQRDHPERVQGLLDVGAETMMSRKAGDLRPNSVLDMVMFSGLLPTPTASDFKTRGPNSQQQGLPEAARNGLLPTPQARDWKGASGGVQKGNDLPAIASKLGMLPTPAAADGFKTTSNSKQTNLNMLAPVGTSSQLNPQFVGEMMGFPPNWTELPFLNGEAKA